ncbi:helix-turn-helix domain-containing protein [Lentilactobacillus sp. IMAU92037]|uniref:helix-turn-helix domain-containing protein n=1 Tax=Lentilactobacillus TaxID=2767893 RepID=UPI001C27DB23|nr:MULTISPECIES: helix-turn-helix transcriptional regulator [Lentilactobacillus]MBU9788191.1 helix-turn-helix domain-containing protein [Lentilactobacillus dabitei]MBV0929563.1 helix-turn-helix domain-containing protein [Lentilactobacillus dabitei]MDM7515100.1 helix-turn-helix transcriptional regulator [Lentilactobacillus sp. TOM.63]
MKIAEQLQRQRQLHGLSQADLADELHISRQSISKWENGTTLPSFSNVVAISDLFGISLDDLIKGDVQLMERLEKDNRVNKVSKIILFGIVIAIVGYTCYQLVGISANTLESWLVIPVIVSFFFMLKSVKWREFNKALTKPTIIWGAIWLGLILIPEIIDFVQGFVSGMNE